MKDPDSPTPQKDFLSPTFGRLSIDELFSNIIEYIGKDPAQTYNLIIGTDSFLTTETVFVSAIIIHRVGHGGRYFYKKSLRKKIENMRQRIFYEATLSVELASVVMTKLNENGFKKLPVEIHLDIGANGDTKDIVREVVGMVTGSGYAAKVKPDSYGASKVADRHSK